VSDYSQTVEWMFQQLPMYQSIGNSAFKKDLTNIILFAKILGNPQNNFKSIHVAGTNGKGSTSHMLASILQEANYKVGLYTSPHLKNFRERIKINGIEISELEVIDFISRNRGFLEENKLSFFEMTVGMAFNYFSEQKVDIAIIEVGLGGRLDSTNIISPVLSVITNIGLDHTQMLGNSLEEIAVEKAGIIKSGIPVIIGETQPETTPVFIKVAAKMKAEITFSQDFPPINLTSDLKGNYQKHNLQTLITAIKNLKKNGWKISEKDVSNGLSKVRTNTGLRGRWDVLQANPKVICDTAHNKEGLKYVLDQLKEEKFEKLHIVFGVVRDKDLGSILPLFPKKATYYFCRPNIPRGLDQFELQNLCISSGLLGDSYDSVKAAFDSALQNSTNDDLIFIGGSNFVVAEVL
jgi:dihydrofolate synthase/folylpolyglutamate synthase